MSDYGRDGATAPAPSNQENTLSLEAKIDDLTTTQNRNSDLLEGLAARGVRSCHPYQDLQNKSLCPDRSGQITINAPYCNE